MNIIAPLCVAIASISYGIPATLVKLGIADGVNPLYVPFFVFLSAMILLNLIQWIKSYCCPEQVRLNKKASLLIIASGITSGLTNFSYFQAVSHTNVAIVAVMLMQSVWIAVLLGCWRYRQLPNKHQVLSIICILIGTILATDVIHQYQALSLKGLFLGFLSGVFYAFTIHFTATLYPQTPALKRASLMSIGAFCCIFIISLPFIASIEISINFKWGGFISIFALVIPLIFLGIGMPKTPAGLGAIITSLELPSAIIFAWLLLNESINAIQWLGILLIILAIALNHSKQNNLTHQ